MMYKNILLYNKSLHYDFIDVADLTSKMYEGIYDGYDEQLHEVDLKWVMRRAWLEKVRKIVIKGISKDQCTKALEMAKTDSRIYTAVGCSTKNVLEFEKEHPLVYYKELKDMCENNKDKVVAIGECGLDYTNLKIPRLQQIRYFDMQLQLAIETGLPPLIRCRNAGMDMITILKTYKKSIPKAVVFSFNGTVEDAREILDLGYYIGLSGCSIKTQEMRDVLTTLPMNRLLLHSDAPACEIMPGQHTNAEYLAKHFYRERKIKWKPHRLIKGRNEPCCIISVLETIAALRNENATSLCSVTFDNGQRVFFPEAAKMYLDY